MATNGKITERLLLTGGTHFLCELSSEVRKPTHTLMAKAVLLSKDRCVRCLLFDCRTDYVLRVQKRQAMYVFM
jgi:hypothetical protein